MATPPSDATGSSSGRAPLAIPWSQVRIVGGSSTQRAVLRHILHGFGWTAIRTIRIGAAPDARGHGFGFAYTIAATHGAARRAVLGSQGEWEAAMVGESYAALRARKRLPRLAEQSFSYILPDGKVVGLGGYTEPLYGRHLQALPSEGVVASRVRLAAAKAHFTLRSLRFVRPYRTLAVIVVTTRSHDHLRQRLGGFLTRVLPTSQVDLGYVQLDTACGRPVFARGLGVAVDRQWFDICDFTLGCPIYEPKDAPPRPTYPC